MTATEQRLDAASVLRSASHLRASSFALAPDQVPDMVLAAGAPERRLLWRGELALLGAGEALRIPLGPPWTGEAKTGLVHAVLNAIGHDGPDLGNPGPFRPAHSGTEQADGPVMTWPDLPSGAVALGALPYDPQSAGYLVVPEVLVARRGGAAQLTLVGPEGRPVPGLESALARLSELARPPEAALAPDGFTLAASPPHQDWERLVRRTVSAISRGELNKVVLARRVEVVANRPFVLHEALSRLASLYPTCAVFHCEGFIGASPETLVRRAGNRVFSHPLAGTIARSGDPAADDAALGALLASQKARHEHALVVEAVVSRLGPYCSQLEAPSQPSVLALRNVSHLGTPLAGKLRAPSAPARLTAQPLGSGGPSWPGPSWPERLPTALELAAVLQPTPAVGGDPTEAAIEWQLATEGFDRGWYAGPVGWVDAAGDGEWVLGLRSAHVAGERAWLYAGNGIVAGSDPASELAETQLKLQALLAALVRP
jgi:menaquinone-specific isochorismate synthase